MDAIYRIGTPTVAEIRQEIPSPPSENALRTLLAILEQKGHVRHREQGPRYVFEPVVPRDEMAVSTLRSVLGTFFQGSLETAVSTLLDQEETNLSDEQLDRLVAMIEKAKRGER
jgi:predicted transcriptional regulator